MGKMGGFSSGDLKKLQKELKTLDKSSSTFIESCAKELAARLLQLVIVRTPTGNYKKEIEVVAKKDSKYHKKGDQYTKRVNPSGRVGGTLRRGWTGSKSLSSATGYADSIKVNHYGDVYVVEIINPVEYASYVEYGHRTRNHRSWVPGHFMLTTSRQELENSTPQILEKKLKRYLEGCFK